MQLFQPSKELSRSVEVLDKGFCPLNMWETARLRVALAEERVVAAAARGAGLTDPVVDPQESALAKLCMQVKDALERGASTQW